MIGDADLIARLELARDQLHKADILILLGDAAREIRRLRAENERLRVVVPPMNLNSCVIIEPKYLGRTS